MTSTDRLAEMAAEIERLRARVAELSAFIAAMPTDDATELRLQDALARITELEAIVTVGHGTMGTLQPGTGPSGDEPATITHNIPPSAPPHDE